MAGIGSYQEIILAAVILATAVLSSFFKKLTPKGAATGALLAWLIWLGAGLPALGALFAFFVFGTLATAWKKGKKQKLKIAQDNEGIRDIDNVLANAGVAGIFAILTLIRPEYQTIFQLAVISAFSTACSDTFSSELGNVYGKRYFHILSLQPSPPGPDGVISLSGLAFGLAGSAIIAVFSWLATHDFIAFFIITLSGFAGNLADSVLGDTLQRKGLLNNHQVNVAATAAGALAAILLMIFIKIS